jgi:hypothetical protein
MVVTDACDAPSAQAFARMAERLIQVTGTETRVKGNVQFFFRRMLEGGREAR